MIGTSLTNLNKKITNIAPTGTSLSVVINLYIVLH